MNRKIVLDNIVKYNADALIYSTNVDLRLSGGVGSALKNEYGQEIQDKLFYSIDITDRKIAEVGEVFECTIPSMPWKAVYHTVATNDLYETKSETVNSVLRYCLNDCLKKGGIHSVVTSALGCGWGDLSHSDFIDIITEITESSFEGILDIIVCCDNQKFYNQMCEAALKYRNTWIFG
jgi:O-acetyl-ADP-ribose deacetylase (regulator of RNase III)